MATGRWSALVVMGVLMGVLIGGAACTEFEADPSTAATGSSANTGGSSSVGGAGASSTASTGGVAKPYPPGPYGQELGETVADFSSQGYRLTSSMSIPGKLEEIALSEFFDNADCSCIVVTYTAAEGCGPCLYLSDELSDALRTEPGLCVLEAVTAFGGVPVTEPMLKDFAVKALPNHPIVMVNDAVKASLDPNGAIQAYPYLFFIDAATMKVLDRVQNSGLTSIPQSCGLR